MSERHLHTCMLCEAVCGIDVTVEGGRVVSVRGDDDDPFSRGHICPKAAALGDISHDADRIREPMRRVGDRWEAVSWDAALDLASARLAAVQKKHGGSAVGFYAGNPTVHSYGAVLGVLLFSKLLGSKSRFSATSVDQLPHMMAALEMFGHQLLMPVPDVDRTSYMLMLGANPLASNGSIMTAPGIRARLEALRERGGALVVVDPRRTETAKVATAHHFIKPGGDAFLLLGMLHTIFDEGLARPGRLAPLFEGEADLRRVAKGFSPERAAAGAGIAPEVIRTLAREFAGAKSAVCYGRVGLCTQEFGGLAAWLVVALNAVTGNLDAPGGFMFTTPAADVVGFASRFGQKGHHGLWRTRVRGLPEFGGELPVATMAEEMTTEGAGRIRALVTMAGNPVLSSPNGARLSRALEDLDFMVSVDIYRNETTRHAHLLLPTSFGLERDHYDLALYAFAVRNAARYAEAALPAPPGVRDDFDVLTDLGLRLQRAGGGRRGHGRTLMVRAARALGPARILDGFLRAGPHGTLRGGKLSLAHLRAHPHGVDLGPLEPRLPGLLATPNGRIRLAPEKFLADVPRLEGRLAPSPGEARGAEGPLSLIGRRDLRSNNSWMHNSQRLVKGKDRCTLLMHPDDAGARALAAGDRVRVASRTGAVETSVEITADIRRGVVSLPHGWGHGREGTALSVAATQPGISINDLTDDGLVDTLTGNASFSAVPVWVTRAGSREVDPPRRPQA